MLPLLTQKKPHSSNWWSYSISQEGHCFMLQAMSLFCLDNDYNT